jgi:hypothetical protein
MNSDTNTNTSATQTAEAKAKRSATIATKREEKTTERGYSLPLVLTCKVTGKSIKYTSSSYIDKCIAKHGSIEALRANYVSREGRRNGKA